MRNIIKLQVWISLPSFPATCTSPLCPTPHANPSPATEATRASIERLEAVAHVLLEERLVVPVPARQSRAALRNVARAPHDAQLVDLLARLVVRAEDVKLALADLFELR